MSQRSGIPFNAVEAAFETNMGEYFTEIVERENSRVLRSGSTIVRVVPCPTLINMTMPEQLGRVSTFDVYRSISRLLSTSIGRNRHQSQYLVETT